MNTNISHQFFSSSRGGKYTEIHEIAVNLGQFTEFFMSNTCLSEVPKLPKPRIPKQC